MKEVMELIQKEVSEKRLYNTVKEVSNFHRIQASTGFRAAANFMCNKLKADGLDAKVLSYDVDGSKWYLEQKLFEEWDCKDAWLEVEGLGKIADFREENISIIQKSYPCDYSNNPLEIVMLESAEPEYLDQFDLTNKICFVHTRPNPYLVPAIKERGALGFISDYIMEVDVIRERYDALDTLNYISFWWKHTDDEPKTWGFVLSPRVGDKLRKLCTEMETAYQKDNSLPRYPKATCKIDSSLYPGKMEVVEVVLPGESDEEVMAIAHLCHPRACANDNSSGVAGSSEALRVLKLLSQSGKIPALKRTIRLTLVPEMTGTYCYLSEKKNLDKVVGAINMDMIGGKQNGFWGPITVTSTTHAINSPVSSIASYVLKYAKRQVNAFQGDKVPLVNSTLEPYTGGSDHIIYSDPTINIPCIMLGQWPDRFYHTSSDTLECVDPKVLKFSTTFAAGFLYALSNFDEEMHKDTMLHHAKLLVNDIERLADNNTGDTLANKVDHFVRFYSQSVENFTRYGNVDTSKDAGYICDVAKATKSFLNIGEAVKAECDPKYDYVAKRTFLGPVNDIEDYAYLSPEAKVVVEELMNKYSKQLESFMLTGSIMNYLDGKRSVNEIAYEIAQEIGVYDVEYVDAYIQTLVKLNKAVVL